MKPIIIIMNEPMKPTRSKNDPSSKPGGFVLRLTALRSRDISSQK
jgi:hypothetical protein